MDMQTMQRVRSHGAALNRHAFDLADQFLDGVFAGCPALRDRFHGDHQSQRRAVAHRWAWVVKNLGHLEQLSPEFEAMGQFLTSRGVSPADVALARTAFLEAVREVAGADWDAQNEADWAETFDACTQRMHLPIGRIGGESFQHARAA